MNRSRARSAGLARAVCVLVAATCLLLAACAPGAGAPQAAVIRQSAPPWGAPRDAISYIDAVGLAPQSLSYRPASRGTVQLAVLHAESQVAVPARIGEDRLRALTAGLHTHDDTGAVSLEPPDGPEAAQPYTLGQFFGLWGVRFTDSCLGDRCVGVTVTVDGVRRDHGVAATPLVAGTRIVVDG